MKFCGNRKKPAEVLFQVLDYYLKMGRKDLELSKGGMTSFLEKVESSIAMCQEIIDAIEQLQNGNPIPAQEQLIRLFEMEASIADKFGKMPELQLEFLKPAVKYGEAALELAS